MEYVPVEERVTEMAPPLDHSPDSGHDPMRFGISQGWSSQDGALTALHHRIALHDLADPPRGYPELSQIEFLDTHVRAYPRGHAVELEDFSLVRVVSLSAQSRFDRALSWQVRAGSTRPRDGGCFGCFTWVASMGAGAAGSFLADAIVDPAQFAGGDIRRNMPRFQPSHFGTNRPLAAQLRSLAGEASCTPAQLALAWLLTTAPFVLPIPGTTSVAHLEENLGAASVKIDAALAARVEALINASTVSGPRYAAETLAEIDTEEFPPARGA